MWAAESTALSATHVVGAFESRLHRFVLLEMTASPGAARWGENEVTAIRGCPNTVPVPGLKAEYVRERFDAWES